MLIIGIDPALTKVGWGVIEYTNNKFCYIDSGAIVTYPKDTITNRLYDISSKIEKALLYYNPQLAVMEETFLNKNAVSSIKLGYSRGAVMALIGRYKITFREYKPNVIKKTVVGVGHADKNQVAHMVKRLLRNTKNTLSADRLSDSLSFDEYDALAIAYTGGVLYNSKY